MFTWLSCSCLWAVHLRAVGMVKKYDYEFRTPTNTHTHTNCKMKHLHALAQRLIGHMNHQNTHIIKHTNTITICALAILYRSTSVQNIPNWINHQVNLNISFFLFRQCIQSTTVFSTLPLQFRQTKLVRHRNTAAACCQCAHAWIYSARSTCCVCVFFSLSRSVRSNWLNSHKTAATMCTHKNTYLLLYKKPLTYVHAHTNTVNTNAACTRNSISAVSVGYFFIFQIKTGDANRQRRRFINWQTHTHTNSRWLVITRNGHNGTHGSYWRREQSHCTWCGWDVVVVFANVTQRSQQYRSVCKRDASTTSFDCLLTKPTRVGWMNDRAANERKNERERGFALCCVRLRLCVERVVFAAAFVFVCVFYVVMMLQHNTYAGADCGADCCSMMMMTTVSMTM